MAALIELSNWPEGRVGFARAGAHRGEFVFVFPEIEGRCGYYTSGGIDDVLPDIEYLHWVLETDQVEWLDPEMDAEVERKIFDMRPLTPSVYDRPPSFWDRMRMRLKSRK